MSASSATLTLNINCPCGDNSPLVLGFRNDGAPLTLEELPRGEWTCPNCGVAIEFRVQIQARMLNGSILESVRLS